MNCFQLIAELITGKYASMKWQTRVGAWKFVYSRWNRRERFRRWVYTHEFRGQTRVCHFIAPFSNFLKSLNFV